MNIELLLPLANSIIEHWKIGTLEQIMLIKIIKKSGIIRCMNTDDPNQTTPSDNNQQQTSEPSYDSGQPIIDLVDALQSVDTQAPEASLNATSIEDNNGDRIELNEDPPIKK